jgi:hypothetical protein
VNAPDELSSLLRARGGLVVRHDRPELAGSFDWLLREGRLATVLPGVYAAPAIAESWRLTPHRAGNRERLKLLIDSRGEPWSAAERLGHRLLRTARIKGWQPNLPVLIDGQVFYIDIAFKQQKLAIEIDGRLHETDEDLFESDRGAKTRSLLMAGGFCVSPGRCCVITLTSSSARFSTLFTENTSRLCQNRTTEALAIA